MALVRPSAGMRIVAVWLTASMAGCATGPASPQARDENRKMDCLTRSAQELEREASRPILVARSQNPEVLPPVRLGTPTPAAAPASAAPSYEKSTPATDIRLPDNLTPVAPITPASE